MTTDESHIYIYFPTYVCCTTDLYCYKILFLGAFSLENKRNAGADDIMAAAVILFVDVVRRWPGTI